MPITPLWKLRGYASQEEHDRSPQGAADKREQARRKWTALVYRETVSRGLHKDLIPIGSQQTHHGLKCVLWGRRPVDPWEDLGLWPDEDYDHDSAFAHPERWAEWAEAGIEIEEAAA